jgi:bifunctional non-homologous end joining protein LigD
MRNRFLRLRFTYVNGDYLTQKPVVERKDILKEILPKRDKGRVRHTEHIVGDGEGLFRQLEKRKLEGMIAKRTDSLYVGSGRRMVYRSMHHQIFIAPSKERLFHK